MNASPLFALIPRTLGENIIFIPMALVMFSACERVSGGYSVSGIATYKPYLPNGQSMFVHEQAFRVQVHQGKWLILSTNVTDGSFSQLGWDGTNSYGLVNYTNKLGGFRPVAFIENEEVPQDSMSLSSYLWLAFSSSDYFQNCKSNLSMQVWSFDDNSLRRTGFKVATYFTLSDKPPRIPVSIDYFADGLMRVKDETGSKVLSRRVPFDKGFTNAHYEAYFFTNGVYGAIPTAFRFFRLAPKPGLPVLVLRSEIFATNCLVTQLDSVNPFPQFTGTRLVNDRRYARASQPIPSIPLTVKDGNWSENDQSRTVYFETAKAMRKNIDTKKHDQRWLGIVFIMVMLTSFFGVIVFRAKKERK